MDEQSFNTFQEVDHTADWALCIRGADLRELLLNAARGMSELLFVSLCQIPDEVEQSIVIEGYDAECLLVNWLSELAYWAEMEGIVFREFILHDVTPTNLRATVRGARVPSLEKHIKAVTYHNLHIIQREGGLQATVVFDV